MAIWIPEKMYVLFPLLSILAGGLFLFTAQGIIGMTLPVLLVSYGLVVLCMRRGYGGCCCD